MAFDTAWIDQAMSGPQGCVVAYDGTRVRGMLDDEQLVGVDGNGEPMKWRVRSVLIRTDAISPTRGTTITVDDVDYQVRDTDREPPDGALTRVTLADLT